MSSLKQIASYIAELPPIAVARDTLGSFGQNEGSIMAGHLAFLGLMSLFPFLICLVTIAGFIGDTGAGQEAIRQGLDALPPDVASVVEGPINQVVNQAAGGTLTFSLLVAVWSASSGMEALRTAIRRAYYARPRKAVWRRRLESLGLVLGAALSMIIGISVQVLGPSVWAAVDARLAIPDAVSVLWGFIHYGLTPLLLFTAIYLLFFTLTPARGGLSPRWPGALLALVVWLAIASGFASYLQHFGNYSVTYGSLAGVIVTLLFFFIVGCGIILGAELNAALARRRLGVGSFTDLETMTSEFDEAAGASSKAMKRKR
ncbi:MAG: YihY/virulence factor BrkB family protein [Pseudomonadota bacterium]